MRIRVTIAAVLIMLGLRVDAADLVRGVRAKLSAGDLPSAIAAVEDYKRDTGADAEYLNAVGWLARGASMMRLPVIAAAYVAELRASIPEEKDGLITPLGAAIEVESKLRLERDGRGSALRFLDTELARAKDVSLRSRISKNINLISLEGQRAPAVRADRHVGAEPQSWAGKPTLLFFWAAWCGDCKAQAPVLERIWAKYRARGLRIVAPTRLYGGSAEAPVTEQQELTEIAKVWGESYRGLEGVTVPIDTDSHVRYGASATPTFVLIDRDGIVRMYAPTRLPEAELERRIEQLLAD